MNFYWEMVRCTDMIRFGKYEGIWTEKNQYRREEKIVSHSTNSN